jgi:hypothetical protein
VNAKELLEAAERLATYEPHAECQCDNLVGFECQGCGEALDIRLLARHLLATTRADDDEPVTERGRCEIDYGDGERAWLAWFPGLHGINLAVVDNGEVASVRVKKNPTKGDVRRLAQALGMEATV